MGCRAHATNVKQPVTQTARRPTTRTRDMSCLFRSSKCRGVFRRYARVGAQPSCRAGAVGLMTTRSPTRNGPLHRTHHASTSASRVVSVRTMPVIPVVPFMRTRPVNHAAPRVVPTFGRLAPSATRRLTRDDERVAPPLIPRCATSRRDSSADSPRDASKDRRGS
jgi:hypothetical protein